MLSTRLILRMSSRLMEYNRGVQNASLGSVGWRGRMLRRGFCEGVGAVVEGRKEKMEFKTETKRLLDIVAKSLYTDSEVFIRELLSNASDALEKQRFYEQANIDLFVNVTVLPDKGQLVIEDNGIGMSRDNLIDHLGTIARSGTKEFVQEAESGVGSSELKDNVIGQFGVGFYSSFIVADLVEVISRQAGGAAHKWSSDGCGTFDISEVQDNTFVRGTKIILHLKKDQDKFSQKTEIQQIIQKYSNFINFPISINGEPVNIVKALWTRPKSELSLDDYQQFYQYLTKGTDKYKFKVHFTSDVPLSIKSILFVPISHSEKYGMGQEKGEVSLYSKKVLIKKNCKQILLPNFLRFMKGVVDCEDIPLNISRQTFQDTALMNRLKSFTTKKVLKALKEEAEKSPQEYNSWYKEFNVFIKEGSLDPEFKKDVIGLNKYETNLKEGYITLQDYVASKLPNQDSIYFMYSQSKVNSKDSPYLYPLTKAGIPVLLTNTHIDEIIFNEMDTFEGLKFANIETDTEAVERILKGAKKSETTNINTVPENDIPSFSMWMKAGLQPYVEKVVVSKKQMLGPALLISPISASMRQMAVMRELMEERSKAGAPRNDLKNLVFEYNPSDQLIVKLNQFRKLDEQTAGLILRQIFDNACIEAGLELDPKTMVKRINSFMNDIIEKKSEGHRLETVDPLPSDQSTPSATTTASDTDKKE